MTRDMCSNQERIYGYLRLAHGESVSASVLVAHLGIPKHRVSVALNQLRAQGKATATRTGWLALWAATVAEETA